MPCPTGPDSGFLLLSIPCFYPLCWEHWRCPEPAFHEVHSFSTSSSIDGSSFPPSLPMGCGITPDCQLIFGERQVCNFICENASKTSVWIRAPGRNCLVKTLKHRECWAPSCPGTSKRMLTCSISVSHNLSHITWVLWATRRVSDLQSPPPHRVYHSRLGKGAKEPLAQAVCGKQWVREGLGRSWSVKTDGLGRDLSQKEGCIRAAWEGITAAGAITQLFLPQNKKRKLDWRADITSGRYGSQGAPRNTINKWQFLLYTLHFRTILILTACFIFWRNSITRVPLGHLSF